MSLAAAQAVPSRVRVSEGVIQGLRVKQVSPIYPPLARQARIQGSVVLRVFISKTGDVENIQLVSGHPMLAPSAIEAVKQWKYQTYLLNGQPVEVETTVTVNFTLAENPPQGVVGDMPGGAAQSTVPAAPQHVGVAQRVRVSSGVESGLLKSKVNPTYPPDARDQRIQGVVLLKAIIDIEGNVANIELISGHPLLAPAAIDAVKQWKYKPFLLNQAPVEVETQIQVNFTLAGE